MDNMREVGDVNKVGIEFIALEYIWRLCLLFLLAQTINQAMLS